MNILESTKKRISSTPFFRDEKYKKYRAFSVPLFALIIAILLSVLVTIPQIYKLLHTYKTIDELKQKKIFYQKKASDLEAIKVFDYRNDLDTALVALPVEKDIPGVIGEILVSLGGSGMHLGGISLSSSPQVSEKTEEYNISIDAAGTETSLRNFLERVKLAPRLVKLTAINVENASSGSLSTRITFTTFYQALPNNISAIDVELPEIGKNDTSTLVDIEAKKRQFPKVTQEATASAKGKSDPFSP